MGQALQPRRPGSGLLDWKNFGKYYLRYFDTAVSRSEYPINNISYALFEHVSDPAVQEAAIKAEKYSMETLAKDDPTEIDTYANLLYKAGRNREAIECNESRASHVARKLTFPAARAVRSPWRSRCHRRPLYSISILTVNR
jgi:hypothetical protein